MIGGNVHGDAVAERVTIRPRRLQRVTVAAAAAIVAIFAASAATLSGTTANGGQLLAHDGAALVGVGILLGLVALTPLRIRATAGTDGIRVFNLVGDVDLPWSAVQGLRYRRGTPWATLELPGGELIAVLAIQVWDGDRAVDAVRRMRALHAAARAGADAGATDDR